MNIYRLDDDAKLAARYHNDRHVSKGILECAQILGAARESRGHDAGIPLALLRGTHIGHPCVLWCSHSPGAYEWTYALLQALCEEYRARFATHNVLEQTGHVAALAAPVAADPAATMQPAPQCMPVYCRHASPVQAYRNYYYSEKRHLALWSPPAGKPLWWEDMERVEHAPRRLDRGY